MAPSKEPIPPPTIGKMGPYTVFVTPTSRTPNSQSCSDYPTKVLTPPPVQPPPKQFDKYVAALGAGSLSYESVERFFKNAVTKLQIVHSSLDEHIARWLGLDQSKYQWAVDTVRESKEVINT